MLLARRAEISVRRLITIENSLHVVDQHELPPAVIPERVEDLGGQSLLTVVVSVDVADLHEVRIAGPQRNPVAALEGDLIVLVIVRSASITASAARLPTTSRPPNCSNGSRLPLCRDAWPEAPREPGSEPIAATPSRPLWRHSPFATACPVL
jgi:hypothetical protein